MPDILVTGGAGFIGSHLVDALLGAGHRVTIIDDFSSGKRANLAGAGAARLVESDIADLARLDLGRFDMIVHLAALISGHDSLNQPDRYQSVNVGGTQRVIDFAAATATPRIVFASSSTVYGNQHGAALSEATPPRPLSVYALTKLAGEHLLRLYGQLHGFSHCSLRLFNVYGPRQATDHPYANVTCKFSHAAAHGLPVNLYGDGEQSRDFVYVADVVRALVAVIEASPAPLYNIGTGVAASINRLLAELARITGAPLVTNACPPWPNDISSIRADAAAFERDFGFGAATPLAEGLARTVAFFADGAK